jgi:hypothetical protein
MRLAAHEFRDHIGVDDDHESNEGGSPTSSGGGSSRSTPPRGAPADGLGQIRLGLVALARYGFAQDGPRFGFHRTAMPGRADAHPLFSPPPRHCGSSGSPSMSRTVPCQHIIHNASVEYKVGH